MATTSMACGPTLRRVLPAAVALLLVPLAAPPARADTFTVTSTADDGAGSLRQAIVDVNASPGLDTIVFAIPGAGPHTIQPTSALPAITQPVVIDGYTQDGAVENTAAVGSNAVLMIELDGQNAGAASGLFITAGGSTVRGLVINRFEGHGIRIQTGGGNTVAGNFIGTDVTGTVADTVALGAGNSLSGVSIAVAPDNVVGGTAPAARNVIAFNGSHGLRIAATSGTVVQGNLIGANAAGDADLPNNGNGIDLVKGLTAGASHNVIGGEAAGAGNVISGNTGHGVEISGNTSTENVVAGNLIGTTAAGDAGLQNHGRGVAVVDAVDNMIGGAAAGEGNVVSGNLAGGVGIFGIATGNAIEGNRIGTDAAGMGAVPNFGGGILILGAQDNRIGGTAPEAGNVISGNGSSTVAADGVEISGGAAGNLVQRNVIGLDAAGDAAVPNSRDGVRVTAGSTNTIGGVAGAGNVIAGNSASGVAVLGAASVENRILGNAIFDNGGLGIDLGDDGVTANDPQDADTGPNNLQNHPVLTAAAVGSTMVEGTLHSAPNTPFRVEFFASPECDPSGHGEGRDLLASIQVVTDGDGDVAFSETLAATAGVPHATATATRLVGMVPTDTSEFSNCVQIEGVDPDLDDLEGQACPPDQVPPSGFTDVAGNVHEAAIDCVAWHGIAQGLTPQTYGPAQAVRRDQMASFIARTMETAGWVFPPATDQGFGDIADNVHAERINQLAEAGVVQGVTASSYAPSQPVRRDQMASFLVRAYELVAGALPPPPPSGFADTAGNTHEANIDKAAAAGFALGTTPTTYAPAVAVRRDQMASFITRVLDRLAAGGYFE